MALPRRWLVFGGSGFLGVHVVRAIEARGHAVATAGRARPQVGVEGFALEHVPVDALRAGDVEAAFGSFAPDAVLVCAALATIGECERYPVLARALNVEFPARIAAAASAASASLAFVSTDLVFGGRSPLAGRFTERDEPDPVSEYGRTKAAGEAAVLARHPGALVARLPLLFGDSFGRGLGASDALLAAVRRGERARLFTDEWRTPLDAAIAARKLVLLVESAVCGVRHVAGPERMSRFDLGVRVLHAAGLSREAVREAVEPCTRAEAGLGSRPADVSLASIHDPGPTLT